LTELPPREVLEERLRRAIEAARNQLILGATGVDAMIDLAPPRGATPRGKGRQK
jgi:GGDEF domain-containing protein